MAEETAISWTDHTKNLWWGCWKIDPECEHCYADEVANRFAPGHWGRTAPRKFYDNIRELVKWNRKAEADGVRRRVFVGSMMDWAERHPVPEIARKQDEVLAEFWTTARGCDWLDFQMLTKRIDDAAGKLPWMTPEGRVAHSEPWPNVWLGVTAGTRKNVRTKILRLRRIPAAVHFVSCEPLLEHITDEDWDYALGDCGDGTPKVDWLIVGNESGRKRRPAELDWVRTARDAAERWGAAFHFKQWVDDKKVHLPLLDGVQHAAFPESR